MNKYILDLISRINDKTEERDERGGIGQHTSFNAIREAGQLNDASFLPELKDFIINSPHQEDKIAVYIILGGIIRNTNKIDDIQFLIDRIDKEDKITKHYILKQFPPIRKTLENDISTLLQCVDTNDIGEKITAIGSLFYAPHPEAEQKLIGFNVTKEEKEVLQITCAVLSDIGTMASIPFLQSIISTKKGELKKMAKYAYDRILKNIL
ncbi:hypothetical protein EG359_01070 [Chryseobacterium joostei]|uniref:HEAT repeat domain-containing protein n=1 Tax=Chryseobacterium joostei TaxID=112234 RepID=A0A1N7IRT8_9FLAO|nr:hypothetical protein [Chryseobacterium joostei]AZA98278.1 hypothetical protein EG359_01070 [Chryseobacterium joostei]SIS39819.1 hypothetical protein SAMN05421768_106315 [Chryseobacterium joostei]